MEGISALPLGQDVSDEVSCNMTCTSSTCDCGVDGTITCDGRNLKAIPQMPACSTLIFLENNQIAEIGEKEKCLILCVLINSWTNIGRMSPVRLNCVGWMWSRYKLCDFGLGNKPQPFSEYFYLVSNCCLDKSSPPCHQTHSTNLCVRCWYHTTRLIIVINT